MKKSLSALAAICIGAFWFNSAQAQIFTGLEYLDINQIKLGHGLYGDMWYDPTTLESACEFPKGSGKHAGHSSAIWVSAQNSTGEILAAASLYRTFGIDYYPGPLDASDTLSPSNSTKWSRIWKIDALTIRDFLALYKSGGASAVTNPAFDVIKEWPATGNIDAKGKGGAALTEVLASGLQPQDFAPFVDVNGDNVYNWQDGDYPQIKGDQMLWWIFNDNTQPHSLTKSAALKLEIHTTAYAYARGGASDRIVFYEYKVRNKSDEDYTNFRLGFFADLDLGNPFDDNIGLDSAYRMGIVFQNTNDRPNGKNTYGANSPISGVRLLQMPGEACAASKTPIGSFGFFRDGAAGGVLRDPRTKYDFYKYMNGLNIDSLPLTQYMGAIKQFSDMKYDNCDSIGSNSRPSDIRFVLTSAGFTFAKNTDAKWVYAFMVTDTNGYICPSFNYSDMKTLADTAELIFCNPLKSLSVDKLSASSKQLTVYPNPSNAVLYIEVMSSSDPVIKIVDAMGRNINLPLQKIQQGKYQISTNALTSGVYSILYFDGVQTSTHRFIKE